MQRRAGDGRVEHELVEVGIVADGVVDGVVDVLRRVVFQADDRRAEDADAVRLQFADQLEGIDAGQFGILAVAAFDAHPHPGDAQADQLLDGVGAQHVGRAEHVERPGFARAASISSNSRSARLRWRRKFSSIMKNERTPISRSIWHMTWNSSSPVW